MSKSKILFCMSGSIAAFKACQVLSRLVQDGHQVQVVATSGALQFIGAPTLEGLSGRKVLDDLWEREHAMDHIELTRWADFALLCPASANTIAKLAHGMADDLVSAMALAWPREKPFHIFPAMNSQMLSAAITQQNLRTLATNGFRVASTEAGTLACGEIGEGRLLEPEAILKKIFEGAQPPAAAKSRGRLLITAGATREPIDGIRFLSNVSTGQTGAALATEMSARGWQVTYLHGQGAQRPERFAHALTFTEYSDLERKLRTELDQRDYTAVIHAAAVSDYSIEDAKPSLKLPSGEPQTLHLKPNAKLLPRLKQFSRSRDVKVIGFKLTLGATAEQNLERAKDLVGPTVDAVVGNDWQQVDGDRQRHPGRLVTAQSETSFQNIKDLAGLIDRFLEVPNDSLS